MRVISTENLINGNILIKFLDSDQLECDPDELFHTTDGVYLAHELTHAHTVLEKVNDDDLE